MRTAKENPIGSLEGRGAVKEPENEHKNERTVSYPAGYISESGNPRPDIVYKAISYRIAERDCDKTLRFYLPGSFDTRDVST